MTVEKRKRVSKKRKIAWRKHSKVKDVENFLEEQDFEERIGKLVELKSDKELFHIDVAPKKSVRVSKKEKRKMILERPLKCFSSFQQPIYVPNTKKNEKSAITARLRKKLEMRNKENMTSSKVQSLKDTKAAIEKKKLELRKEKYNDNLWMIECINEKNDEILSSQWVSNSTKQNILKGESKFRKRLPKITRKKQTILPAIEPPHPGMSYNPSFDDHQALLRQVAEKEQEIIKKEKHLDRVTTKMFKKVSREQNEKNWIEEMSQGLPQNDKEASDAEDTTDGKISVNPPVVNKKKDLKTRRKQKEQQKLRHALSKAKIERRKIADIYKLRQINTKIKKKEEIRNTHQKIKEKRQKDLVHQPKRVGRNKFVEHEPEFSNIEDLTGNLRTLKKEGNLLLDRLKSLQKRNVIEPTALHIKKKAKVKKFVKPGHKEDWKSTIAKATVRRTPQLLKSKKK